MSPRTLSVLVVPCVALALAACRDAPAGVHLPAPADSQITVDLVGVRFAFFEDAAGEKRWTIEEGEVRDLRVIDGSTADDGGRHRARVRLTLAAPNRTIRGDLDVYYLRAGGGWTFEEAARAGGNWSVVELAAVVYEARPAATGDSTDDGRGLWLEPMFRFHDGEYAAPLDAYRPAVDALDDSSFASDSLRRAAYRTLESRIASRYLDPSWTVFLLAPGSPPAPTRFASRDASVVTCSWIAGGARAESPAAADRTVMATSSSTMGGAVFAGRDTTPEESDRLAILARGRLAAAGVPQDRLGRLRGGRALAADVDGDGTVELVGAFAVAGDAGTPERALLVVGRPAPAAAGLVAERVTSADDGWGGVDLVGAIDIDGDGDLEVVARETGSQQYRYVVLARRPDGAWEEVFAGGGGGCY